MQRIFTLLGALAALTLLAPGVASAQQYTGTLEFGFGFGGTGKFDPDEGKAIEGDTDGLIAIMPGLDKMLGKTVGLGAEMGFIWLGNNKDAEDIDRTFVINPNLRLRMSFPIVKNVTFDGMIAIGPAIWMANDSLPEGTPGESTRFGWAYRFNFGGSYQFNEAVAAFLSLGWYSTSSFGDDVTLTQGSVPLNLGLRSAF